MSQRHDCSYTWWKLAATSKAKRWKRRGQIPIGIRMKALIDKFISCIYYLEHMAEGLRELIGVTLQHRASKAKQWKSAAAVMAGNEKSVAVPKQ